MSQSTSSTAWSRVLVLSCIATAFAFAMRASGEQKQPGGFATVDLNNVFNEDKARDSADASVKDMQRNYAARLQRRSELPFLTEDEQKQLDTLHEKAPPAPQDQAKIDELEGKGKRLSDELRALQQKPEAQLNDADKAKLKEFSDKIRDAQGRALTMKDTLTAQLDRYVSDQHDTLMKKIREAVGVVAKRESYSAVFSVDFAPYAGPDITTQVITEVNKK